jgi:hypothetical protein
VVTHWRISPATKASDKATAWIVETLVALIFVNNAG